MKAHGIKNHGGVEESLRWVHYSVTVMIMMNYMKKIWNSKCWGESETIKNKEHSKKLQECELNNDNEVTEECDLVHMALMADVKSIKHLEALMSKTWKKEMKEDIFAIEKNDIWELIELPSNKNVIKVK